MAAQRKKVLLKREQDKSFGFLKIETSIKPESRLSKCVLHMFLQTDMFMIVVEMRRMIKANIMGNAFDLSDKFSQ